MPEHSHEWRTGNKKVENYVPQRNSKGILLELKLGCKTAGYHSYKHEAILHQVNSLVPTVQDRRANLKGNRAKAPELAPAIPLIPKPPAASQHGTLLLVHRLRLPPESRRLLRDSPSLRWECKGTRATVFIIYLLNTFLPCLSQVGLKSRRRRQVWKMLTKGLLHCEGAEGNRE